MQAGGTVVSATSFRSQINKIEDEMIHSASEQASVDERHAEDAEKGHGDNGASERVPADEETEGATNALKTPVAPPEMAKDRNVAKK